MLTTSLKRQIGEFIARVREERGLTQGDLAKKLGTSQSAVARMEAGAQNLSMQTIAKISRALDRSVIGLPEKSLNFRIEGGRPLSGEIEVMTSKNSAVLLLCAAILNRGKTTLRRMPHIEEVNRILEVLGSVGVSAKWVNGNDIEIQPPKAFRLREMNIAAAMRTRSVIMLLSPLIHRLTSFALPHPGGCRLGKRTVRPHLFALERFGVSIETTKTEYRVRVGTLKPAEIVMYESGDTATANAIIAAAGIEGETVIKFASANYQVQDVCRYLQALGVEIDGVGTTTLTIRGRRDIAQEVEFSPTEDPIEAMCFLSLAATTRSSITIKRCPIEFLELELFKLEKMGFKYKIIKRYLSPNGYAQLVDIRTFPSKLYALEEKIEARPYPGLNIDNLPFFVPIATQAEGTTLIHDWVYESRAIYYMEMNKLGADLILADPHRVYVEGPTKLKAAEVVCPPALRPAVIILIGMLAAHGTSVLRNVYSINRGYEDLARRLNALGAKIEVLREF